ncbi:MAG: hypothetical protein QGG40_12105, partial [Myxococcota bacterium]|nr:hypothetical protein [Myxococcota bacterium]
MSFGWAGFFEAWGRWVAGHRYWALFLSLVLTAGSVGLVGARLSQGNPVDFTLQSLFLEDGPDASELARIEEHF